MSRPRVLVLTHGLSRAALAASRALRAGGWDVGIGSPLGRPLSAASRATRWQHWVPGPAEGLPGFVAAVGAAVDERGYEVVFGADDAEVLALAQSAGDIAAAVPYPPYDVVAKAIDKLELTAAAARAGLPAPRTETELSIEPPVVVKSRIHGGEGAAGARQEAILAATREQARAAVDEVRAAGGEPIVQELVRGRLMAIVMLVGREGELLACVQQQAELTWPDEAGVTVRGSTVAPDRSLCERTHALLRDIGWWGLAELQFLRPPDGGEPRLIDLNGRFYGSLALANASGVNLPAAWAAIATGRPLPPLPEPRAGVRYQWLEGELRRAYAERREGLAGQISSALRYAPGAVHSIWSVRDPWPALRHGALLARRGIRRAPV